MIFWWFFFNFESFWSFLNSGSILAQKLNSFICINTFWFLTPLGPLGRVHIDLNKNSVGSGLVWPNFCCTLSHILQGPNYCPIIFFINFHKSCWKLLNSDFQSQPILNIKNYPNLSIFLSLRNINLGAHFCYLHFLTT